MSTEPAGTPARPRQITLAASALSVLGAVLVFVAAIYVFGRDALVEASITAARDAGATEIASADSLRTAFAIFSVLSLVLAVVAFVAAAFVWRRRGWARFLGIGVGVLFGVFSLQSLLGGGNVFFGAVEVAVAVIVVATLLNRQTAAWFAAR